MGGKLNIYNLGEYGVDVVKSPLHDADGDLIRAQNATPDPAGLEGGIRKRDGMAKLNSLALTGAIQGTVNIPLPAPGTRTYYAGEQQQSGVDPSTPWHKSVGGTSWANSATPTQPHDNRFVTLSNISTMCGCLSYRRRLFYPGKITVGAEHPNIRAFDGTLDQELCRIPPPNVPASEHSYVGHLWMHRGVLYACVDSFVYEINVATGSAIRVDPTTLDGDPAIVFGLSYLDRAWFGGSAAATNGVLYWRRNGEDSLTLDRTAAAGHLYYMHGANFLGDLYVGTLADAGTAAIVEKRTAAGTWTTSFTGPDASVNHITAFAVFDGELYCVYRSSTNLLVKKFDGSSWSTDFDVIGTGGFTNSYPAGILAESDALYIAFAKPDNTKPDGYLLRRTLAGAWSKVRDLPNGNGSIGFLP